VAQIFRVILNIMIGVLLFALLLAAITAAGAYAIARAYPPAGRFVDVAGGRLHVLELGPADAMPVVLLHGASGNLQDMRLALGDRLATRHRVILIDRPGHGWSDRPGGDDDAVPARQAALIDEALRGLGVKRAIIVGHSFGGAVALAYALAFPDRVAGLALLAPVSHSWTTGIAWFYKLTAAPVIGQIFARTVVLPLSFPFLDTFARVVFAPQPLPEGYGRKTAAALVLRPSEFVANAKDIARLLESVTAQAARYGEIAAPTVIITGDRDTIVSPTIHSKALAATLPHARLILLPGIGHAVQHVAADAVVVEIDKLSAVIPGKPQSGATRDP
jgi:pimeloyl-ACP methyl ester carboxylesterase